MKLCAHCSMENPVHIHSNGIGLPSSCHVRRASHICSCVYILVGCLRNLRIPMITFNYFKWFISHMCGRWVTTTYWTTMPVQGVPCACMFHLQNEAHFMQLSFLKCYNLWNGLTDFDGPSFVCKKRIDLESEEKNIGRGNKPLLKEAKAISDILNMLAILWSLNYKFFLSLAFNENHPLFIWGMCHMKANVSTIKLAWKFLIHFVVSTILNQTMVWAIKFVGFCILQSTKTLISNSCDVSWPHVKQNVERSRERIEEKNEVNLLTILYKYVIFRPRKLWAN